MFSKTIVVILACQLALSLAAPAVETSGNQRVQNLINELENGQAQPQPSTRSKKITTTTITTVENTLEDDAELKSFMRDPEFVERLKEFLTQFIKMYNSMLKLRGGSASAKINEGADVKTMLGNPEFFKFLNNFFETQYEGGLHGFIVHLHEESKHPGTSTTITNGQSHVVSKPQPTVTITHIPDNNVEDVLNHLTTTTHVTNQRFPNYNEPKVTVNDGGISTSENLINELNKGTNNYVENPTVTITKVTTSNHQGEENSADYKKQVKDATYQFATLVDDKIMGNYQQRAEVRQNGVVTGKYSYDDGNGWTTVYYKADADGFRITKTEKVESHMKDITGEASVQTLMNGRLVDYKVTAADVGGKRVYHNTFAGSENQ